MSVSKQLALAFQKRQGFTLKEAYAACPEKPEHAVRARIYDGIKSGKFQRLARGVFCVVYQDVKTGDNLSCVLIQGDGRDLSFLPDDSIDCILTDHPYKLNDQLKGGNRDFASYDLFRYTKRDFEEKLRVLKPGCFLVEFIPEESASNFAYLSEIKRLAMEAGFEYYAKVPWTKGNFIANTGRKSKNSEDILFMTKGPARCMRPDAKKDKLEPSVQHFMRGAAGMLPTDFDFDPPRRSDRIHQAEKPVELIRKILSYVCYAGETVLDQFAGSGSTGEAALLQHLNAILIEKSQEFFDKIADRLGLEPAPDFI